jgi:hypothetical protein
MRFFQLQSPDFLDITIEEAKFQEWRADIDSPHGLQALACRRDIIKNDGYGRQI